MRSFEMKTFHFNGAIQNETIPLTMFQVETLNQNSWDWLPDNKGYYYQPGLLFWTKKRFVIHIYAY